MSENVQLVESLYAAFGRGDIPFILERLSEDVEWTSTECPEIGFHGTYRGRPGVVQFFQNLAATLQFTAFGPETFLAAGDEVMTTGRSVGTSVVTGKTFSAGWAMRFIVKNGQVTYFREIEDTASILDAVRP